MSAPGSASPSKVAIVTGGSRGIGMAIAERLAADGHAVVITSRSEEGASVAAGMGPDVTGFVANAADVEQMNACIEFTLARHGSLDVLVNNAGTNPAHGRLVEVEGSRFTKTVEVNLRAPISWTAAAWKAAMRDRGGVIVNVASVGGLTVELDLGVYNATKAALIHVTRQLACELAPGVRVNAVAPGVVRTRLSEKLWRTEEAAVATRTPLGRIGEPSDVAAAVSFLAGDDASWVTGQTLVLDGGRTLAQE
jgi:NAD(P)-dependent dehydrogenase (short-subunit alcohol dehydrogenase family)